MNLINPVGVIGEQTGILQLLEINVKCEAG
jgi:hypothetical protein